MKLFLNFKSAFNFRCLATLFVASLFFISCSVQRSSKFTSDPVVKLGIDKNSFIQKFGSPVATQSYNENGKIIDVLKYSEWVYQAGENHFVESSFVFEDSKLVKIDQDGFVPRFYDRKHGGKCKKDKEDDKKEDE